MRRFAIECGAVIPSTLRGTNLRKHIATYTSLLNVEECKIDKLANFLGHAKEIHKTFYRVPVPFAEITEVSKMLLAAIGEDDNNGEENEYNESDKDENCDTSDEEDDGVVNTNEPPDESNSSCDLPKRTKQKSMIIFIKSNLYKCI